MKMKNIVDVINVLFIIMSVKLIHGSNVCGILSSSVNCSGLMFTEVPIFYFTKIEVLDLSVNHIRQLYDHSFSRLSRLRVLILRQNSIFSIEQGTFSSLTKLTDLDLSINVLPSVPCHLPTTIRRLNLDDNRLRDESGCLQCFSPLTSLESLSMRRGLLNKFPRFCESTPNLVELDVFGNPIDALAAEDLALLCGLRRLNVSISRNFPRDHLCECSQFQNWLQNHSIQSNAITCNAGDAKCNVTSTTVATYQECLKELEFRKNSYLLWIGGIILLVVGFCVTFYAICRRRRKRSVRSLNIENAVKMTVVSEENDSHVDKN